MKQSPRPRVPTPALTGQHDLSIEPRLPNKRLDISDGCASLSGEPSMLTWMSRPREALLSGLSCGAEHAGYGGPGGVVLPGADHGGLQLFVGVDQGEAGVGEQGDGVGFGARSAAGLAFAEGAALDFSMTRP